MRGLDPRIHHLLKTLFRKMDGRVKPGHFNLWRSALGLRGQRENGVVRCDQGPAQYMLWEIDPV
jgi:hypothetical protein